MSTDSHGVIMSAQVSAMVPYADLGGVFVPASHVWYKTNKNKYNEYPILKEPLIWTSLLVRYPIPNMRFTTYKNTFRCEM